MTPNPEPGPGPSSLPMIIPSAVAGTPSVHAVPSVPPALATKPDPIELLKALQRRWPLAVGSGVLLAVIVAGVVYGVMPPAKYTARAMLHVNSVPPRIILPIHEQTPDYAAYQRTQLALLKSRLVLNTALKQDDVKTLKSVTQAVDPVEWLEKELQVDFANGSEILRISMSRDDPKEPMILVNAVTRAYLDEVVDVETKQRRERYDLLKETWNRYQENLREKRKELKRLTELAGSDDKKTLANIQQHELDRLGRAEDELARVRTELRTLKVEFEVLQGEGTSEDMAVDPALIEEEIRKDSAIELLAERVAQLRKTIDRVAHLARSPSDPALQRHRGELSTAQKEMAQRRAKLYPVIARELRDRMRGDLGSRAALLQERIKILSGLESALLDDVKRLGERSRTISRTSVDLSSIQEEISAADAVAKTIGAEIEGLNVELLAPPRIRPIERAELPRTKDETRPIRMAGMAGCGAFALALIAVAFLEFRTRRVDSPDELVRGLGVRLVGTLPNLPERSRLLTPDDPRVQRWQNLLIESVDAARLTLLHASRIESIRVVMIASALGGEGKTSLTCHLASSLARAGRRTLLIDGDLRRPSAHRLFDLPQDPGLCDVLRGEVDLNDVILPTPVDNLYLLPAGTGDSQAIQALTSDGFWADLDRLKEQFDFILIDSSPVLPVADALLTGQYVDGVILSVMRGVSRLPKVYAAHERMTSLGIRVLGAVVTGMRGDLYGSEYQYTTRPWESS